MTVTLRGPTPRGVAVDGDAGGPYRRRALVRRALLPLAHAALGIRARGPRLHRWAPRSPLHVASHPTPAARFAAVDFHTHLGRWLTPDGSWMVPDVGALVALMERCNVSSMVNLDGRWGAELEANLDRYDRAHPGRFFTFCHLDWRQLDQPEGPGLLARSLRDSADAGARGLKVWKDLGLTVTVGGKVILPDAPVLAPVWQTAAERGLPVLIHVADPFAFFEPVDRHNERLEELLRHPSRSLAKEGADRFRRLIDALEALVSANPATTFVGAHVGCYAERLEWVDRMLSAYPNFWVDLSGRVAELGRQPRAAARLIQAHADRVLFGTDVFPPTEADYEIWFRALETEDECFSYSVHEPPPNGRWQISGLGLGDDTLAAIYARNARVLLGTGGAV